MSGKAKGVAGDFKRRKQKVGKKKLAPANVTNTSFKWATLNVDRPDLEAEEATDSAQKRQESLKDLLSTCRHHNVTSRKESVVSLRQLLETDPGLLLKNLGPVMSAIADRIVDSEPSVRSVLQELLRVVISIAPWSSIRPFMPLIVAHLSAALSRLHTTIRLDALALAADLLEGLPECSDLLLAELGGAVVSVMEPQLHTIVSSTLLAGILPRQYDMGSGAGAAAAAAAAAAKGSAPNANNNSSSSAASKPAATSSAGASSRKKLTSIEARVGITYVLRRLLLRGKDAPSAGDGTSRVIGASNDDGGEDEDDGAEGTDKSVASDVNLALTQGSRAQLPSTSPSAPELQWSRAAGSISGNASILLPTPLPAEAVKAAMTADLRSIDWTAPLASLVGGGSSAAAGTDSASSQPVTSVAPLPAPLAQEALLQLLQLWLESAPTEAHAAGSAALVRLGLVAHTMRLVLQSCPSLCPGSLPPLEAASCFAPITVQDGNLLKALRTAMDEQAAAVKAAAANPNSGPHASAVTERSTAVVRLTTRALRTHLWGIFPVVPSSLAQIRGAQAAIAHKASVALLNTRLCEVSSVLLPPSWAVSEASGLLQAAAAANSSQHTNKKTKTQDEDDEGSAGASGSNPFALLAPKPRPAALAAAAASNETATTYGKGKAAAGGGGQAQQKHQQQASRKRERQEPSAVAPVPAPAPLASQPAVPSVYLTQSQQASVRRGLAEVAKLSSALLSFIAQTLQTPPATSLGANSSSSSSSSSSSTASVVDPSAYVDLLPCFLQLLQARLLQHASPAEFTSILTSFNQLYTSAPPRSAVKAQCLRFVLDLLGGSQQGTSAAAGGAAPSVILPQSIPSATSDAWLSSFPRLLWALGTSDVGTSGAMLSLLLEEARRAPAMSARHSVLADVARQCAPMLYTTRTASSKGAGGAASSAPQQQEGVLGPFTSYPAELQCILLAFLRQVGELTPALRRALCVTARLPLTSVTLTSLLVETGCELAKGRWEEVDNAPEDSNHSSSTFSSGSSSSGGSASSRLGRAVAEQLAFLLSLVTGRTVAVSSLSSGPQLTVAPPSATDIGMVGATFESVGRNATAEAKSSVAAGSTTVEASSISDGLGWGLGQLCSGDDAAYERTLKAAVGASAGMVGVGPSSGAKIATAIEEVLSQLVASEQQQGDVQIPSTREAALLVSLYLLLGRLRAQPMSSSVSSQLVASLCALHRNASTALAAQSEGSGSMQTAPAARSAQPLLAPSVEALLAPDEPLTLLTEPSAALRVVYTLCLRSGGHAVLLSLLRSVAAAASLSSSRPESQLKQLTPLLHTLLRSPAFAPLWREDAVRAALRPGQAALAAASAAGTNADGASTSAAHDVGQLKAVSDAAAAVLG